MDYMVKIQQAHGSDLQVSLYERLLSCLIINQMVPVEAVYTLSDNYSYITKLIQRGISDGDIKKRKLEYKYEGKEYTVTVLTISRSGFKRYATSVFIPQGLFDIDFENLSLAGGNSVSRAEYTRQVQMSEARLFASAAGAAVNAFPVSMVNEKKYQMRSYVSVVKRYLEEYEEELGRIIIGSPESSPDIAFRNNREIKNIVEEESSKSNRQVMGFQRCLFNGIIDSQSKSVLMYSPYSVGFRWGKWEIQEDVRIGKLWSSSGGMKSTYNKIADDELRWGMFFVKNKRQFGQYYRDDAKRRAKGTVLGYGFKHFYAVPKSNDGAKLIRFLMLTEDGKYNLGVANGLISNGQFSINENSVSEFERKMFPIIDGGGNPTFIGIQMDVRKMQEIENWKNAMGNKVINVACFDWQMEYYNEIFDNLRITVIPAPKL